MWGWIKSRFFGGSGFPRPPWCLIALVMMIILLVVLFVLFPKVMTVLLLFVAVGFYYLYKSVKEVEIAAEAAQNERGQHLYYAARALLYGFFRLEENALCFAVKAPSTIEMVEANLIAQIAGCPVMRFMFYRPSGAPVLDEDALRDLLWMLRRWVRRGLCSCGYVVPPVGYGQVPVLYVHRVEATNRFLFVDVVVVSSPEAAAALAGVVNSAPPPSSPPLDCVDVEF